MSINELLFDGVKDVKKIDIKGVDKVLILRHLWFNSEVRAGAYILPGPDPSEFDVDEAAEAVKDYIDYFQGRSIKMDLTGDTVDGTSYDRHNGPFATASAVIRARNDSVSHSDDA